MVHTIIGGCFSFIMAGLGYGILSHPEIFIPSAILVAIFSAKIFEG